MTAQCKFFAQGICRNEESCKFMHEPNTSVRGLARPVSSAFPVARRDDIIPTSTAHPRGGPVSTTVCEFFLRRCCNKGDNCRYAHPPVVVASPQQDPPDAVSQDTYPPQDANSPKLPPDSRGSIRCRFLSRPGGCKNDSCPYLHTVDDHKVEGRDGHDFEENQDEESFSLLDIGRNMC
jgi:hypothetical protein